MWGYEKGYDDAVSFDHNYVLTVYYIIGSVSGVAITEIEGGSDVVKDFTEKLPNGQCVTDWLRDAIFKPDSEWDNSENVETSEMFYFRYNLSEDGDEILSFDVELIR